MDPDNEFAGMKPADIDRILRDRIANDERPVYWRGYRAAIVCHMHDAGLSPKSIATALATDAHDIRSVLRYHATMERLNMSLPRLFLDLLVRPFY